MVRKSNDTLHKTFMPAIMIIACIWLFFAGRLKSQQQQHTILGDIHTQHTAAFFAVGDRKKYNGGLFPSQEISKFDHGALIRGSTNKKQIALVFTADEFADGGNVVLSTLQKQNIKGSFFFTGRFYRNPAFESLIKQAKQQGHYLGPHSDQHLLYCDWTNRDSLLVTKQEFKDDLTANLKAIEKFGVKRSVVKYYIPPYEWYNDSVAVWTKQMGMQLVNYSPGTKSTSDYTTPEMKNYRASDEIYQSIIDKEKKDPNGLNGFILLIHFGTDPKRTDKFYNRLEELITTLKKKHYQFTTIDQL